MRAISLGATWVPATCTKADLSVLLDLSPRALTDMDARGLLIRAAKNGTYQTIPTLHAVVNRLRNVAAGREKLGQSPAAEEKLLRERAERQTAELKLKQLRGEILTLDEVTESWSEFAGKVKAAMLSVPGKARSSIPHLTPHDAGELKVIVTDILNDLADEVEASVVSGDKDALKK